jgi:hypothetical protein
LPKNSLDLVLVEAEVLKAVILWHRVEIQSKIWKDGLVDMTKEAMADCGCTCFVDTKFPAAKMELL